MLSRQIVLSDLLLRTRPILETIPDFGIGFKLCRQRSSVFQDRTDDGSVTSLKIVSLVFTRF